MSEVLRTDHLSIQFGGLKAVNDVSFQVNEGETFGIIGPNGAGKTTLFNMCSGIYKPTSGDVYLCGEKITGMHPENICNKGLCRTFQSSQLFAFMSVLENVKVGCHIGTRTGFKDAIMRNKRYKQDEEFAYEKSLEIIEKVGLKKYIDTKAGNLSYGIQRKVEIARALATDPKILLLDEPAAGMNPNETADLMDFVNLLHLEHQTVLLIEHDMKFVMNSCKRILVLNFGQKICEGTPEEVRNNKDVQEAYFGSGMVTKGVC
ncbi:MAG: ABC transporter ATP-binding protein [Eubacteriales bacterium]|nr:ABC transporter ATP-binding protein [Eubacteriales bacterium]